MLQHSPSYCLRYRAASAWLYCNPPRNPSTAVKQQTVSQSRGVCQTVWCCMPSMLRHRFLYSLCYRAAAAWLECSPRRKPSTAVKQQTVGTGLGICQTVCTGSLCCSTASAWLASAPHSDPCTAVRQCGITQQQLKVFAKDAVCVVSLHCTKAPALAGLHPCATSLCCSQTAHNQAKASLGDALFAQQAVAVVILCQQTWSRISTYSSIQREADNPIMLSIAVGKGNMLQLTLALKGLQVGCGSCRSHLGLQAPQLLPQGHQPISMLLPWGPL